MSGLQIKLTTAGRAEIVNAENTGTAPVRISHIGVTAQAFVPDADMAALPGELKRLSTFAGAAVADDTIHVTIRDDSADAYGMRGFGLYLESGTLFGVYGQADVILEKSAQAMLLLAADIRFADIDATSLTFGDTDWINPPATTTTQGVVELATNAEAETGTDTERAVPPAALKYVLDQRFGEGAPSGFVKGLLALTTAALLRTAIGLGSAALRNEGANNGLDADKLDGQHGAYYLDWANLTGKPTTMPPSAHNQDWSTIDNKPATATRWPVWTEVTGKPNSMPPDPHTHAAADITSGTFPQDRIPALPISHVTSLQGTLDAKVARTGDAGLTGSYETTGPASGWIANGGALRSYNWAGNASNGRLILGDASSYIFKNGAYFDFVNAAGGYTATLSAGGTIWTSNNFNPAEKASIGSTPRFTGLNIGADNDIYLYESPAGALNIRTGPSSAYKFFNFGEGGNFVVWNGAISAAGGFDFGSSRKLKDIDGAMPYGLAEVRQIATLIGRYKSDYNNDGRRRLFFDAEQFMGVMPEVVDPEGVEFNGERVPSIKLDQVMPPAYRAIAELADAVDALREEIAALKASR